MARKKRDWKSKIRRFYQHQDHEYEKKGIPYKVAGDANKFTIYY